MSSMGGSAKSPMTNSASSGVNVSALPRNWKSSAQRSANANPSAKFLSSFTGDFEDPTKAQQAAQAMFDQAADGLVGNLNNGYFGMFRAADDAGIPVEGL